MSGRDATEGPRQLCDTYAARYDRDTGFYDRFLLADRRGWARSQATGSVLEVAIGTQRNLLSHAPRHHPSDRPRGRWPTRAR